MYLNALNSSSISNRHSYSKENLWIRSYSIGNSSKEIEDIMKIVWPFENRGLLIKAVSEITQNEAKEQKGGFLSMLLWTSVASLLENLLTGKSLIRAGEGTIRVEKMF